jgi:two-component system, OmpR family, response regulator
MRVLIVEDDPAQAQAAAKALSPLGHEIIKAHDGESAVRFLKADVIDLVVLDWHLPGMSGFEVLHWIRAQIKRNLAVLFLTSRVLEVDIVLALEAGADDYLIKPFRLTEFAARVNALLRRTRVSPDPTSVVRVGEYVLNSNSRTILLRCKSIDLTTKEFDVVALLFHNIGKLLSREFLTMTVWGRELDVASRTLDTHVYRARQKLFLNPENGLRLSAIYTHGYRLDDVSESSTEAARTQASSCIAR